MRLSFPHQIACGAVLLLIGYTFYIKSNPAYYPTHQHIGQINIIHAQKFMHDRRDLSRASVLVGSSLSQEMFKDRPDLVMRHELINLAFASKGPFDGLELLRRKEARPRRILIELNTIPNAMDLDFVESIHSPIWTPLRKRWRILRLENQPVGVFVPLLYSYARLWWPRSPAPAPTNSPEPAPTPAAGTQAEPIARPGNTGVPEVVRTPEEERRYQKYLAIVIHEANKGLNYAHYDARLAELRPYIKYFMERGTEVILYEVPVDAVICPLKGPRTARQYVPEQLGAEVRMIALPDCNLYQTRDGLHLVPESLARYQLYLLEQAGVSVSGPD